MDLNLNYAGSLSFFCLVLIRATVVRHLQQTYSLSSIVEQERQISDIVKNADSKVSYIKL